MLHVVLLALLVLVIATPLTDANEDPPPSASPAPTSSPLPVTAESRYGEGQTFAKRSEWAKAEEAYRDAARLNPSLPEAWNGLGYALRKQRKFNESLEAYQQALKLRPRYPQALEYLGEAYVQMGRLKEAREVLIRLEPLDREEAADLRRAIESAEKAAKR